MIGVTPSDFISFQSKLADGRKNDSLITIESGLLDKLNHADILADKDFPRVQEVIKLYIDKSRKITYTQKEACQYSYPCGKSYAAPANLQDIR